MGDPKCVKHVCVRGMVPAQQTYERGPSINQIKPQLGKNINDEEKLTNSRDTKTAAPYSGNSHRTSDHQTKPDDHPPNSATSGSYSPSACPQTHVHPRHAPPHSHSQTLDSARSSCPTHLQLHQCHAQEPHSKTTNVPRMMRRAQNLGGGLVGARGYW